MTCDGVDCCVMDGTQSVGGVEVNCNDEHDSCEMWASVGECNNNPNYMLRSCRKSFDSCDGWVLCTCSTCVFLDHCFVDETSNLDDSLRNTGILCVGAHSHSQHHTDDRLPIHRNRNKGLGSDPSTLYGLPQQYDSSACHEIISSTSTSMTTEINLVSYFH